MPLHEAAQVIVRHHNSLKMYHATVGKVRLHKLFQAIILYIVLVTCHVSNPWILCTVSIVRVTIVNVSSYEVPHRPSRTGHHTSYPNGNVQVTDGNVRVTIGNVSATIGNLRATTGNERVTIDKCAFCY